MEERHSQPSSGKPWERVGAFAAASSASEIGLGSALHGMNIPFSGHFLANAQGLLLGAFVNREGRNKKYVFFVAVISAALKSFSPAGKRFRPMLAIFMQGLLFHLSVNLLGAGALGIALGQSLIGAWCSFQTFAFQYLFFGKGIVKSYERIFEIMGKIFPGVQITPWEALGFWAGLNAILSAGIGLLGFYGLLRFSVKRPAFDLKIPDAPAPWRQSLSEAARELRRPYFLWPFLFVLIMGWLAKQEWEDLAFTLTRAVLAAFLCVLAVKRLDFPRIMRWLEKKGHVGPAKALNTAIEELNGTRNS